MKNGAHTECPDGKPVPVNGDSQPPTLNIAQEKPSQKISITGRFDQYRSSFLTAALAIIGIRYAPRPFLRLTDSWKDEAESQKFYKKHAYSAFGGGIMEMVTGFFAYRTYKDMKSIFAQALAWEFDKDPGDITASDMRHSKNTVVQQTNHNYVIRNLRRAAVNLSFFSPYIFGSVFKKLGILTNPESKWSIYKWSPETGADLGISANAVYLFSDVIGRKGTPFEALQTMIDLKINHANSFADKVTAADLLDIYERHAAHGDIKSFLSHRDTFKWDDSMQLFNRMADLMNQAYKNIPVKEKANFGISEFIYLVGNGMISPDQLERSRNFIEVANSHGISEVKKIVKELRQGTSGQEIWARYNMTPLPQPAPVAQTPSLAAQKILQNAVPSSYAEQAAAQKEAGTQPYINL